MKTSIVTATALLAAVSAMAADRRQEGKGVPVPSVVPKPGQKTSAGCWSAQGDWTKLSSVSFVSSGSCGDACTTNKSNVYALKGEACFCGDNYPPLGTEADLEKCNYPCPGFDQEACGSLGTPGFYSVFLTGLDIDLINKEPEPTSTSSSTTPAPTSIADALQPSAPIPTELPVDEPPSDGGGGGSNPVGIAVGVVLGVILIAAAAVGGWFWLRRKRQQEGEEERRRADAVNTFVGGHKSGSDNGSFADSRLDPVMAHRRMSDGSIADNHDYSRKILRVTNA